MSNSVNHQAFRQPKFKIYVNPEPDWMVWVRATQLHIGDQRSNTSDEADANMDVQQKRRGVASWIHAERRIYGKSTEIMCGYWYEKPFMLKMALMMFLGLTVLLLPQYLTFNSSLRQRLIGSSLLVVRGTSFVVAILVL